MAYILIDGYNLIGTAHDDLEKERNDLIDNLKKYSEIKDHHVTVVFDGWKAGQKDQTRITTRNVTVIYSRLGETADQTIRTLLLAPDKHWIVVSSDREVADYAATHDYASVSSAEFEKKLFLALRNQDGQSTGDRRTSLPFPRSGGNPGRLSKRQRKKMQALSKL
ncbi:MAG: hypothetical protein C4581_11790 [Nitrospiraceae bacterium]|nr:MAG: hypothetical protein C4581_11790 [Nitrospiraceae bacterium]